jgi:ribonuclease P protein component
VGVPEEASSEAHLPAKRPQARQAPRVPSPHVDPCRPSDRAEPSGQGSDPAVGLTGKIRRRGTFELLRAEGIKVRRGPLAMTYVDDGEPTARVAYAVPRRVGTAVERNRIRRRLRAVLADQPLQPGAHLVSADRSVLTLSHTELVARVGSVLEAVEQRREASR